MSFKHGFTLVRRLKSSSSKLNFQLTYFFKKNLLQPVSIIAFLYCKNSYHYVPFSFRCKNIMWNSTAQISDASKHFKSHLSTTPRLFKFSYDNNSIARYVLIQSLFSGEKRIILISLNLVVFFRRPIIFNVFDTCCSAICISPNIYEPVNVMLPKIVVVSSKFRKIFRQYSIVDLQV